jgi:hypothetical protein
MWNLDLKIKQKKDMRCPEFKPQYHQKSKQKKNKDMNTKSGSSGT